MFQILLVRPKRLDGGGQQSLVTFASSGQQHEKILLAPFVKFRLSLSFSHRRIRMLWRAREQGAKRTIVAGCNMFLSVLRTQRVWELQWDVEPMSELDQDHLLEHSKAAQVRSYSSRAPAARRSLFWREGGEARRVLSGRSEAPGEKNCSAAGGTNMKGRRQCELGGGRSGGRRLASQASGFGKDRCFQVLLEETHLRLWGFSSGIMFSFVLGRALGPCQLQGGNSLRMLLGCTFRGHKTVRTCATPFALLALAENAIINMPSSRYLLVSSLTRCRCRCENHYLRWYYFYVD